MVRHVIDIVMVRFIPVRNIVSIKINECSDWNIVKQGVSGSSGYD